MQGEWVYKECLRLLTYIRFLVSGIEAGWKRNVTRGVVNEEAEEEEEEEEEEKEEEEEEFRGKDSNWGGFCAGSTGQAVGSLVSEMISTTTHAFELCSIASSIVLNMVTDRDYMDAENNREKQNIISNMSTYITSIY